MLNKPSLKVFSYFVPVVLWMGVIFYFSSIPGNNIPTIFPHADIVAHLVVFAILGFLFSRAVRKNFPISLTKVVVFTLILGILYGCLDEFHQSFVPNRNPSCFDVLTDAIGSLIGSLIFI